MPTLARVPSLSPLLSAACGLVLAGCSADPVGPPAQPAYGAVVPTITGASGGGPGPYVYAVAIDGAYPFLLGVGRGGDTVLGLRADAGHTARLLGVPAHCSGPAAPLNFTVEAGVFLSLPIAVSCGPAPAKRVEVVFGGTWALGDTPGQLWGVDGAGAGLMALTGSDVAYSHPAWSPDGSGMTAWGRASDGLRLYRIEPDVPRTTPLTDILDHAATGELPSSSAWSPDGRRLAVAVGGAISLVDAAGGGSTTLAASGLVAPPNGGGVAWSPDGTRLAVATDSGIAVVAVDGTGAHAVSQRVEMQLSNGQVSWSPDGTLVGFVRYILDVTGGCLLCADLWFDAAGQTPPSPPGYGLWVVSPDGTGERRIADLVQGGGTYAWSPEGSRIALVAPGGVLSIVRSDTATGTPAAVTALPIQGAPMWSSDGTSLSVVSGGELHVVRADGSGDTQLTHESMLYFVGGEAIPVLRPRP